MDMPVNKACISFRSTRQRIEFVYRNSRRLDVEQYDLLGQGKGRGIVVENFTHAACGFEKELLFMVTN